MESLHEIYSTNKSYLRDTLDYKYSASNDFVLDIIPKDKVEFLIREKKLYSIKDMSSIFKVSQTAMKYRLQDLGWLNKKK